MEDYGNRLEDYVNGHEQDDDDGDVEGDFCYGIHECIRRRMQGNKPTDMEVDGYPLGDYSTGSLYDPTDRGLYTMHEEGGSDEDENDMAVCLPTTDAGDFAYQIYRWKAELCGVPSHVIMNQVGNLCNR